MSLDAYKDWITQIPVAPKDTVKQLQQAWVDAQWLRGDNLLDTVGEETAHGTFIFQNIEVWKNSISEFTITVIKDEKDYRRLMFQDQSHNVERGRYYYVDDSYFMVYYPTSEIEPYREVYIRRCNNIAKWIDSETGIIHSLPCILDYDAMSPSQKENKDIITPNNSIVLMIQGNEDTLKFKTNDRFIFSGRPFKIEGYNNYMEGAYVDRDVNMLFFNIYLDEKLDSDDYVNGIANYYDYNFEVTILSNINKGQQNTSGTLKAQVTLNDKIIDGDVTWSSNANGTITSDGVYTLTGNVGDTATFTATYGNYTDSINVLITSESQSNYEIIVTPNMEELYQNQSVTFTPELYLNNVKITGVNISATASGADDTSCYTFVNNNDGTYTLTCLYRSKLPVIITYTYNDIVYTSTIKLKAIF